MQILMGLIGMVALLAIAVLLSNNRKAINLRTVLGAWIIQVGYRRVNIVCTGRARGAISDVEWRRQRYCLRQ
ncbi:Nucleoside permease NupC [Klebsiella pneumoniae]|nr:Nucleoside permease NupC [Klebsiella pneumoniae]